MLKKLITFTTAGLMLSSVAGSIFAQEKKPKDYISDASPHLYLSCEGFVATFGEDEKKMKEVVGLMVAVSFINREIDAAKVLPEKKDQEEFGEFLEKALTTQCEEDLQSLMVTNVDRAVAYAFDADENVKKE